MDKELDLKQRVLVAFYLEYQKEIPFMDDVKAELLQTDPLRFKIAVNKLENEGYISGADFVTPKYVRTVGVMVTRDGLRYVEDIIGINTTMPASEKIKEVSTKVTKWGYNELKDFAAKVLGEVISKSING